MIPDHVYETIDASADALDRSGRDAEAQALRAVAHELKTVEEKAAADGYLPGGSEG